MTDAFISYSRRDSAAVRRLADALADAGRDVWVDWEDIPPSADWLRRIHDGIDAADAFVFVLTPDSAASTVCGQELDRAVDVGKRVVPVLLRPVDPAEVPPAVAALNWIDLTDDARFGAQVAVLLDALATDLAWVQQHTQRLTQALAWRARDHDRSVLLRGRELDEAEAWLGSGAGKEPPATPLQVEFVQASRQAAVRRQRALTAGVSVALVVALVLAGLALVSRNEAQRQRRTAVAQARLATSRELSASAALVRDQDPELSLILADEALATEVTDQAESATREALLRSQVRASLASTATLRTILSADHRWAVTVGTDGVARSWRTAGGQRVARLGRLALVGDGGFGNVATAQGDFAPVGDRFLAVTQSGVATLFDPSDGHAIRRFGGPTAQVAAFAGDDGVVVGDRAGVVTHYDLDGAVQRRVRVGSDRVFSLSVTDDGRVLAASTLADGSGATTAGVWDLRSGARRSTLGIPRDLGFGVTVHVVDGGGHVVTSSRGDGVRLWSSDAGSPVGEPIDDGGAVAVSGDGTRVAVARGAVVDVVDSAAFLRVSAFDGHGAGNDVTALTFLPNGLVLSAARDRRVLLWSPGDARPVALGALVGAPGSIGQLAPSADGRLVATSAEDGARAWNPAQILSIVDRPGTGAAVAPDGRSVVVFGDGGTQVVGVPTGRVVRRLSPADGVSFDRGLSADGSTAWLATGDARVDAFATASGRRVARVAQAGWSVTGAAGSADGRTLAVHLYRGDDHRVVVQRRGERARSLPDVGPAEVVAVSADGSVVAVAGAGQARFYDAATGRLRRTVQVRSRASATAVALTSDGRTAAISGDERVVVRRLDTGRAVGRPLRSGGGAVAALAFSPDGRRLAAGADTRSDVWELGSGRTLLTLDSDDRVTGVVWSADGRFLLTEAADTRVYLSEGERTQDPLVRYPGVRPSVSRDGRTVVTVDESGVRVWPCDVCQGPAGLRRLAAARITRPLTEGERRRYLHAS